MKTHTCKDKQKGLKSTIVTQGLLESLRDNDLKAMRTVASEIILSNTANRHTVNYMETCHRICYLFLDDLLISQLHRRTTAAWRFGFTTVCFYGSATYPTIVGTNDFFHIIKNIKDVY